MNQTSVNWAGVFPAVVTQMHQDQSLDLAATAKDRQTRGSQYSVPVGCYPAGAAACGALDMAGNVWEWTGDPFRIHSLRKDAKQRNAQAARQHDKTIKGGSFLCHRSYCYRYRIAARSSISADSASSNTGFRIVYGSVSDR